ncbi:hypothetical protein LSH36_2154g00001 [Paralvinella palmiformis]|uniref:Uncharacterized protein n=1 Tax=Paralvinella palmiformis TaxID=53620 RepID=A0AAD9IQC2_9ANNE|nr:hypothetical protein LSH36_2154g00001 [Paralvinella palmiformis]
MKVVSGQESKEKMPDIVIYIQTMRNINELEIDPYNALINSQQPLLSVDHSQPQAGDGMALLKVHSDFKNQVISSEKRRLLHTTIHDQRWRESQIISLLKL